MRYILGLVLSLVCFNSFAVVKQVGRPLQSPYTITWSLYLYEQPLVVNYFAFNCTIVSQNALAPELVDTYGSGSTVATCNQAGFEEPDHNDPDSRIGGLLTTIVINGQEFDGCQLIQTVFDQGTNSGWQAFNCF
jgi:hypothetical protein